MTDRAILTGDRLGEIERELARIRYDLNGMSGWDCCVQTERDKLWYRRAELEGERRKVMKGCHADS